MVNLKEWFGLAALIMETAGVLIILLGCIGMTLQSLPQLRRAGAYREFRQAIGRVIILGLEFLIAGDIIRTVVVSHSLESVAVLVIIVLIRAFLSITLEYGIGGRWPWRRSIQTDKGQG